MTSSKGHTLSKAVYFLLLIFYFIYSYTVIFFVCFLVFFSIGCFVSFACGVWFLFVCVFVLSLLLLVWQFDRAVGCQTDE